MTLGLQPIASWSPVVSELLRQHRQQVAVNGLLSAAGARGLTRCPMDASPGSAGMQDGTCQQWWEGKCVGGKYMGLDPTA